MIKKATDKPGDYISYDHLISHEPGSIAQVIGMFTYMRYSGAIIFTDHSSDFTYTHPLKDTTTEEVVLVKRV